MRYVAAPVARFATVIVETTAYFNEGTVYASAAVVAAGADCPNTLYTVAIYIFPLVCSVSNYNYA
jgi:hypothetical protein